MDWNIVWIIVAVIIALVVICNLYEYKKLAAAKTTSFEFLPTPIAYGTAAYIMLLALPVLTLYRLVLYLILWIKHGRTFGGFLRRTDVILSLEKECICQLVCIVQYDTKANKQPFHEFARKKIRDAFVTKFRKDPKSFAIVEKGFGYFYWIKDAVAFDEICGELESVNTATQEITKADLMRLINENINKPMIMDNKVPWQMLIGTQPLRWTQEQKDFKQSYPIVTKMRHSIGDGLRLYQTLLSLFADDVDLNLKPYLADKKTRSKFSTSCNKFFLKLKHYVNLPYVISVLPSTIMLNLMLMTKEPNILHGPKLINEKIIYFNAEETPHYVKVIKRIKQKIRNCSFEDVALAALTASFGDYFKKNASSIPNYLAIETPVVPEMVGLRSLLDVENKEVRCQNTVSAHIRKLPLGIAKNGTSADILKSIEFITRERNLLTRRVEKEVFAWIVDIEFPTLPVPLLQYCFDNAPSSEVTITNMPGPTPFTVAGGYPLQDIIPFAGHTKNTGITITISSYNDRLKLCILVDKVLINEEEKVQSIVDGFYKYIDLLDTETKASDVAIHL